MFFKHCAAESNQTPLPRMQLERHFQQTNKSRQDTTECNVLECSGNANVTRPIETWFIATDATPSSNPPTPPTQLIALIHLTAAMIGEPCSWYTTTRTSRTSRTYRTSRTSRTSRTRTTAADIQQLELPALTHFSDKTTSVKTVYSILTKMWSNSPPNLEETSSCIVALRPRIGGRQESENILWISS